MFDVNNAGTNVITKRLDDEELDSTVLFLSVPILRDIKDSDANDMA